MAKKNENTLAGWSEIIQLQREQFKHRQAESSKESETPKSNRELLIDGLNDLRHQIQSMRPKACCEKAIYHETGGKVSVVCANDCKWQKLERILATVMVDADLVSK